MILAEDFYKINFKDFEKNNPELNLSKESNLRKSIKRFDTLAFWVAETIVECKNKKKYIEYFIKVAHQLLNIRNFNGMGKIYYY